MSTNLDELNEKIGTEIGVSEWFEVDQARIDSFADATLDHQFIHVDREKAKSTPFGSTIAHGFLSLSLLSHLCEPALQGLTPSKLALNYGFDKVRFITPVKVNDKIRARAVLKNVEQKEHDRLLTYISVTVEIKGEDKPGLVAEWLTMVFV